MRRAHPFFAVVLALLMKTRSLKGRPKANRFPPMAIIDDIVWLGALFFVTLVSAFTFAAAAMISAGDLRAFAMAVALGTLSIAALAITRLGFRLAAFSASVSHAAFEREPMGRYPVANDR